MKRTRVLVGHLVDGGRVALYVGDSGSELETAMKALRERPCEFARAEVLEGPGRMKALPGALSVEEYVAKLEALEKEEEARLQEQGKEMVVLRAYSEELEGVVERLREENERLLTEMRLQGERMKEMEEEYARLLETWKAASVLLAGVEAENARLLGELTLAQGQGVKESTGEEVGAVPGPGPEAELLPVAAEGGGKRRKG